VIKLITGKNNHSSC